MVEPNLALGLEKEFYRATRECQMLGYNPTGFKRILDERGPVASATHFVMGNYAGFERLWRLRRLDLSVEAIILREPYRTLFPPEVLERAEQKLREVEFFE